MTPKLHEAKAPLGAAYFMAIFSIIYLMRISHVQIGASPYGHSDPASLSLAGKAPCAKLRP